MISGSDKTIYGAHCVRSLTFNKTGEQGHIGCFPPTRRQTHPNLVQLVPQHLQTPSVTLREASMPQIPFPHPWTWRASARPRAAKHWGTQVGTTVAEPPPRSPGKCVRSSFCYFCISQPLPCTWMLKREGRVVQGWSRICLGKVYWQRYLVYWYIDIAICILFVFLPVGKGIASRAFVFVSRARISLKIPASSSSCICCSSWCRKQTLF